MDSSMSDLCWTSYNLKRTRDFGERGCRSSERKANERKDEEGVRFFCLVGRKNFFIGFQPTFD
jgi:hypothetical protein